VQQPSSTITAAFLAGLGISLGWLVASEFFGVNASEALVSLSVTFGSSLVGYLKPENVYPNGAPWKEEGQ